MDINKAFLRFDVRGNYPSVVDEELAGRIGKAIMQYLKTHDLAVAYDNRSSSVSLAEALMNAAASYGDRVISFGQLPIPLFYYGIIKNRCPAGIMVTASHISMGHNGFKFVRNNALPLNNADINNLKALVHKGSSLPEGVSPKIIDMHEQIKTEYLIEMSNHFADLKWNKGKIVLDTGSSSVAAIAEDIFQHLGLPYILINPEREPNPLIANNRRDLSSKVLSEKASLGISWDGDGDRVIFVDARGELIPPSYILGIIARNYQKAVFDVRAGKSSYTSPEYLIVPSWAQNLKYAMDKDRSIGFGGETSGHLIFAEWYRIDDGLFSALKFLQLCQNIDLETELLNCRNQYPQLPEENIPFTRNSALVLERMADYYRNKGNNVLTIDGVTVSGPDFKFNLRESLTEALLRLNVEASSPQRLNTIHNEITRFINES